MGSSTKDRRLHMNMFNPFQQLKARLLLVGFLGIGLFLGICLAVLEWVGFLPVRQADPLLIPLINILTFASLCLLVIWQGRRLKVEFRYVIGNQPKHFSWLSSVLLTVSLLMFSLGMFQVSYYAWSFVRPELVEMTLQESPAIFIPEETANPVLYEGLMFLSIVVVAPIAEEFLFRGILIHRWATKWGGPTAVIASSILFGILHPNPLGLSMFGLVMALLYLRTQSLWAPIFCHALNNFLTIGLEIWATQANRSNPIDTLAEFRENWWMGLVFIFVSAPWLIRFVLHTWRQTRKPLPYFVNAHHNQSTPL